MTTLDKRSLLRRRLTLVQALRRALAGLGYEEVETPLLVRAPGMEPPIQAFRTEYVPELGDVPARPLWLHTSPEFAMKRLVADGWERPFQLAKVFRNGEVSRTHNPEFTLLEFYRARADYRGLMDDVERVFRESAGALGHGRFLRWGASSLDLEPPFDRVTVRDAMLSETGLDLRQLEDPTALRDAARRAGFHVPVSAESWDDLFFTVFLSAVEPKLGRARPTFLIDYPARLAALARVKPEDPTVAERFELYAAGLELANGFSELTDPVEQRRRFELEQDERRAAGREVYPLDEVFLEALGRMPPTAGVAVGVDRLAMLFTGAQSIDEVLLFPANEEWRR